MGWVRGWLFEDLRGGGGCWVGYEANLLDHMMVGRGLTRWNVVGRTKGKRF